MLGQGTITINNSTWQVSIAADPVDLSTGLGNLLSLPAETGELFDLGQMQTIHVTTVPMLFALDIAFLDENLSIIEVYHDIQPGYLVTSIQLARYFLEVSAGELAGINPGDQAGVEVITQPVITSAGGTNWTDFMMTAIALIVLVAFIGTWLSLNKSKSQDNSPGSKLLAANRKKNQDIEIEILDWGSSHKLVKIYRNGRVFAATYAEPFPTKESAQADYLADPRSFLPFDESTGRYLPDAHKQNGKKDSIRKSTSGKELDYLADDQEFLAYTIDDIGYREKLDQTFLEAINRARRS